MSLLCNLQIWCILTFLFISIFYKEDDIGKSVSSSAWSGGSEGLQGKLLSMHLTY